MLIAFLFILSKHHSEFQRMCPLSTWTVCTSPLLPVGIKASMESSQFLTASLNTLPIRDIFSLAELLVGSVKSSMLLSSFLRLESLRYQDSNSSR